MNSQHSFRTIYSNDEEVYRIIDMTDTRIVGIVESYEYGDDKWNRVTLSKAIKEKRLIGAKIVGYCVFILLDEENSHDVSKKEQDYLFRIMRQMAIYFKTKEIETNPHIFEEYKLTDRKPSTKPVLRDNKNADSPIKTSKAVRYKKVIQIVLVVLFTAAVCVLMGSALFAIVGLPVVILMDKKW